MLDNVGQGNLIENRVYLICESSLERSRIKSLLNGCFKDGLGF